MQDISTSLNISKTTVSLVLNGRGDEKRVSKETQRKVIKFATKYNYNPNQLARSLSRGKSEMIGLIVPNISDCFFAGIARRIEKKAEEYGYNVIFSSTGESGDREAMLIRTMLHRQVDGLIIVSCQKNEPEIAELKKRNFPFVLVDRNYPGVETNYVGMNNDGAIEQAVNQLIKCGKRRIGFVSLTDKLEPLSNRMESYVRTMNKNGLVVEEGFIQKVKYDNIEAEIQNAFKKMLDKSVNVDGIVFATQFLTTYGVRELKRLNYKIPDDVALVSFGQMNNFDLVDPAVTSLILPVDQIGDKAVEYLVQNINNEKATFEKLSLNTRLVVRKSCGNA